MTLVTSDEARADVGEFTVLLEDFEDDPWIRADTASSSETTRSNDPSSDWYTYTQATCSSPDDDFTGVAVRASTGSAPRQFYMYHQVASVCWARFTLDEPVQASATTFVTNEDKWSSSYLSHRMFGDSAGNLVSYLTTQERPASDCGGSRGGCMVLVDKKDDAVLVSHTSNRLWEMWKVGMVFDWAAKSYTLTLDGFDVANNPVKRTFIRPFYSTQASNLGFLQLGLSGSSGPTDFTFDNWQIFIGDRPTAPQDLTVEEGSAPTDLALRWNAPADPGSTPILGYRIYSGPSASEIDPEPLDEIGTETAYDHLDVGFSQTRYYQVSAFNSYGEGARSPVVAGTTPDPIPPGPPRNPSTAAGPESGQVTVTWQAPERGSAPRVTHYTVERSDSPTGTFVQVGAAIPAPVLLATDTAAPAGVTSYYRVVATNSQGPGPASAVVAGRPEAAPGAPRSLTATAGASGDVLAWRAPLGDGGLPILEYLAYSTSPGSGLAFFNSSITKRSVCGSSGVRSA